MKPVILALLLAGAVGVAAAQPAQQPSPGNSPPSTYPQSTAPQPSDSGTAGTTGTSSKHAMMKQCVSQQEQQAASSGMSKKDIKEYCKKQVKQATSGNPQ